MAVYARVDQGVVREVVETNQRIEDLYHPDLLWVDLGNVTTVCTGWIVAGDGFSAPAPETIVAAAPTVDIADLARRVCELQEQLRSLAPDTIIQSAGRT